MSLALVRLQWSKRGITGYDGEGSFAFRIEHPKDIEFMTRLIIGGLAKINQQMEERKRYASHQVEVESGTQREHQTGDSGGEATETGGSDRVLGPTQGEGEEIEVAPI